MWFGESIEQASNMAADASTSDTRILIAHCNVSPHFRSVNHFLRCTQLYVLPISLCHSLIRSWFANISFTSLFLDRKHWALRKRGSITAKTGSSDHVFLAGSEAIVLIVKSVAIFAFRAQTFFKICWRSDFLWSCQTAKLLSDAKLVCVCVCVCVLGSSWKNQEQNESQCKLVHLKNPKSGKFLSHVPQQVLILHSAGRFAFDRQYSLKALLLHFHTLWCWPI
jgi:hypothetical protein